MATVIELPEGDVSDLLPLLDGATYVNLHPGVAAEPAPTSSPLGAMFGARGPAVPLATWTPGEIGLLHGTGPRLVRRLAQLGHPVPDHWYVVQDHPKRGLVVRTYDTDPRVVLGWLVRAAELVCPLEVVRAWRAEVT
ncbi:MAG: hypothetical protein AB7L84_07495 [Acidimicrobiia bacterium]